MSDDNDYKVGRGKPPLHTQFKKGQTGNPSGARRHKTRRNKRSLTARDLAIIVANEKVAAKVNGKRRFILMKEAMIRQIYHDFMEATPNVRSRLLFQLIQMGAFDMEPELFRSREERVREFLLGLAAEAQKEELDE